MNKQPEPVANATSQQLATIIGRVVNQQQQPIAGAKLFVTLGDWGSPQLVATTDQNGDYRIEFTRNMVFEMFDHFWPTVLDRSVLSVYAEGMAADWKWLDKIVIDWKKDAPPREFLHSFTMQPDFPIEGQMIDLDNKPVANVRVFVRQCYQLSDDLGKKLIQAIETHNLNLMEQTEVDVTYWKHTHPIRTWHMLPKIVSDAEGRFIIRGVPENCAIELYIMGPGIFSNSRAIITRRDCDKFTAAVREKWPRTPRPNGYYYPAEPNTSQGLQLFGPTPVMQVDPARTVSGYVRDAETGKPIPGLEMTVTGYMGSSKYITEEDGWYCILRAGDHPWTHVYNNNSCGYFQYYMHTIRDAEKLGDKNGDIMLPKGTIVRGRVTASDTGQPIVSRHGEEDLNADGLKKAGHVYYYPIVTPEHPVEARKETPMGIWYNDPSWDVRNLYNSSTIHEDGTYAINVPPGPGVLFFVGEPDRPRGFMGGGTWPAKSEIHLNHPYLTLIERAPNDGTTVGDRNSWPGFHKPITLREHEGVNAYCVINPTPDQTELPLDIVFTTGGKRTLEFVDSEYRPLIGVTVQGMYPRNEKTEYESDRIDSSECFKLEGSSIQIVGLFPDSEHCVAARLDELGLVGLAGIRSTDPETITVIMGTPAKIKGRIVDQHGRPARKHNIHYEALENIYFGYWSDRIQEDGRFERDGLIPGVNYVIKYAVDRHGNNKVQLREKPFVFKPGEDIDLGQFQVTIPEP